jgi:hypothetical protein
VSSLCFQIIQPCTATTRVPSPPRAHHGGTEEEAGGGSGDAANIGPMARPRHTPSELPEWRKKALAQDKVKVGLYKLKSVVTHSAGSAELGLCIFVCVILP